MAGTPDERPRHAVELIRELSALAHIDVSLGFYGGVLSAILITRRGYPFAMGVAAAMAICAGLHRNPARPTATPTKLIGRAR